MYRPRRRSRVRWYEKIEVNPPINRGVLAVLLLVVAGLSILSFFDSAGVAGKFVDSLLAITFGQVRYAFPLVLLILIYFVIKDAEYKYRPTHLIGAVIFLLSFNGLVHIQKPIEALVSIALQGFGGGLAGLVLSWPALMYLGYWGGLLILIGLMLVGIILLFNTSLANIVDIHKKFLASIGWMGARVVALFSKFEKSDQPIRFKIKGEYEIGDTANQELGNKRERATTKTDEEEAEDDGAEEERRIFKHKAMAGQRENGKNGDAEEGEEKNKMEIIKEKIVYKNLPSLDLLHISKSKPTSGDIKSNAAVIKDMLHNFGIEVEMGEVRVGPTVTQYSLKPDKGVKLARITGLSNDLALALAAHPIRIEAPIPGKALVGIEVPNQKVAMVTLRELLESPEYKNREHSMMVALGKDVAGKVWFGDLLKMPHMLIAGATGSGKTVCINTVILSLLFQNTPETLRLIMVDPKRVELTLYNGIPHLLTPVITDAAKTVNALKWVIGEMDRRFDLLSAAGKRDIQSYNKATADKLPYIVFVIDELADLMTTAPAEVEAGIIRIAQMARAVGIHLIVATQRPSVEVITGLMKANIPARLAFSVASIIDSRTILDCPGAEKLLGRGDMLLLTAELSKPKRLQGAYVSEEEMKSLVTYLQGDEPARYDDSIVSKGGVSGTMSLFGGPSDDQDPLFEEAKRLVIESGKASASLLQRRMKVGYARAARLLDELEENGIVGPGEGAKPREVFAPSDSFYSPGQTRPAGYSRPPAEPELEPNKQTMDAGGSVFDSPEKITTASDEESLEEKTAEENSAEKTNDDPEAIE
ncbi:MAG: DNA translocase FtsK 4TM domain-containing protein [Candidatus Magasanikbacteria bacterium]|nr:DNA translocase FtsK 4TM domain-containing protein [Candidatus Magasanikbacteria bacterium]